LKVSSVVVVSAAVRGRARLHVRQLQRQPALGWHLRERLSGDDRIRDVRASALTGNVLVHFDAGRLHVTGLRRLIAQAAATYRPWPASRAAERRSDATSATADGPAWHTREAAEVVAALNETPALGLSTMDAEARLAVAGPNRLPTPQPKSGVKMVWDQIGTLPVGLLAGAAALSIATGGLVDGVAILTVIALNAAIGYTTEAARGRGPQGLTAGRLLVSEMCAQALTDLAIDPCSEGSQQEAKLDANLNAVLRHRQRPERAGPAEVQLVAFPRVGSAEFVLQPPHQCLREALGLRQSQVVLTTDDDHDLRRPYHRAQVGA
jgi:Cation transporter/ATPase, N-terminus